MVLNAALNGYTSDAVALVSGSMYITTLGVILIAAAFAVLLAIAFVGILLRQKDAKALLGKMEQCEKELASLKELAESQKPVLGALDGLLVRIQQVHNDDMSKVQSGLSALAGKVGNNNDNILLELKGIRENIAGFVEGAQKAASSTKPEPKAVEKPVVPNVAPVAPNPALDDATVTMAYKGASDRAHKQMQFKADFSAADFGLEDTAASIRLGNYNLNEYRYGDDLYGAPMILIDAKDGNALIYPAFNRLTRGSIAKFQSDGWHRFFTVQWNEEYPKLISPAKVRLQDGKVAEVLEMGELT